MLFIYFIVVLLTTNINFAMEPDTLNIEKIKKIITNTGLKFQDDKRPYLFILGKQDAKQKEYLLKGTMHSPDETLLSLIRREPYSSNQEWEEACKEFVPKIVETYKVFLNPCKKKVEKISKKLLMHIQDIPQLQHAIAELKIIKNFEKMDEGLPAIVIYPNIGSAQTLFNILTELFPNEKCFKKLTYAAQSKSSPALFTNQAEFPDKERFPEYFDQDRVYLKENLDTHKSPQEISPYALLDPQICIVDEIQNLKNGTTGIFPTSLNSYFFVTEHLNQFKKKAKQQSIKLGIASITCTVLSGTFIGLGLYYQSYKQLFTLSGVGTGIMALPFLNQTIKNISRVKYLCNLGEWLKTNKPNNIEHYTLLMAENYSNCT